MKHRTVKALALAMLLLLLPSTIGWSALAEDGKPDSWISDDLKVSMLYYEDARMPYNPDWGWVEFFKEHTGVTLDIIVAPAADFTAKANTMIASGSPPDFITNCSAVFGTYFNDGVWLPISDYWDYMPHFKAAADAVDAWETIENFRELDGKFYNMPEFRAFTLNNLQLFFRKDLMAKYELEKPTTLDEFTQVLRTLKENEPDLRGFSAVEGLGPLGNYLGKMFGDVPVFGGTPDHGVDWYEGAFRFGPTTDVARAALEWVHTLVEEKILDEETFSMPREQLRTYMSNGKYFANICYYSDTGVATSAGVPVFGEDFGYSVGFPPETSFGRAYSTGNNGKWQYTYAVTAHCLDRLGEEKFIQAVQFFDWMRYSPEAWNRYTYGVEGVSYNMVDGEPVLTDEYDGKKGGTKSLEKDFGCAVLPFRGYTILEREFAGYSDEYAQFQLDTVELGYLQTARPSVKFTLEDQDTINQYWPSLKTYVDEMAMKFILGDLEINDANWATYAKECASRGADKILAAYTKAAPEGR